MITDKKIAEKAKQLEAENTPFALATVVACKSPTSARPGYKAIITAAGDIYGWIGGGCAQPAVVKTVRQTLRDGQPQLIRVSPGEDAHPDHDVIDFKSACHSGGSLDIFIEPVLSKPALLLFGSSVVAQSLANLAHFAGFSVAVASPSAEEAMFPRADQIVRSFDLAEVQLTSAPLVVIATQGKGDEVALRAALEIDTYHRAFVASEPKAQKLKEILRRKGFDADKVEAIIAPAGIAIGADSPEEIAVSVLAGLIAARHSRPGIPAEITTTDSAALTEDNAGATCESALSVPQRQSAESGCCGGKVSAE